MHGFEDPISILVGDIELTLQPLDSADVALTPAGASLLRNAALTLLAGQETPFEAEELSLIQLLALFTDMVCWEETSGRLYLCANLSDTCYCLPVPPEHWRIMTRGQTIH